MNRLSTLTLTTMALLFLGVALPSGDAVGQQKSLRGAGVGPREVIEFRRKQF